jgi:signal transduction histidine kinase
MGAKMSEMVAEAPAEARMSEMVAEAPAEPREVGELRELRHEVGNALTTVSAHAQLLLRRLSPEADPRERQALVAIQDGLLRASRLLRPAPAAFPPNRCDLQALVALAISQVPPERVPDLVVIVRPGTPVVGRGHPERIVQVLANLLDNAVKYSRPGTPIEVETYWLADAATDWALIVVRDKGIGIDQAEIEAIFAGHRTAAASQTALGSGLGLQLSRRLIEAEGGQLWATVLPGAGSAFYVKLPLTSRDAD